MHSKERIKPFEESSGKGHDSNMSIYAHKTVKSSLINPEQ